MKRFKDIMAMIAGPFFTVPDMASTEQQSEPGIRETLDNLPDRRELDRDERDWRFGGQDRESEKWWSNR
jgi:hypothetical protein